MVVYQSEAEYSAVNRVVVGSSPVWGVKWITRLKSCKRNAYSFLCTFAMQSGKESQAVCLHDGMNCLDSLRGAGAAPNDRGAAVKFFARVIICINQLE